MRWLLLAGSAGLLACVAVLVSYDVYLAAQLRQLLRRGRRVESSWRVHCRARPGQQQTFTTCR